MMEKNKTSFRKTIVNLLTQNHASKKAKEAFLTDINEREQLFLQAESILKHIQKRQEKESEKRRRALLKKKKTNKKKPELIEIHNGIEKITLKL